jgi:hypothetical protein
MALELIFDSSVDLEKHMKDILGEATEDDDSINLDQFCQLYKSISCSCLE